jgi:hypothetical protein
MLPRRKRVYANLMVATRSAATAIVIGVCGVAAACDRCDRVPTPPEHAVAIVDGGSEVSGRLVGTARVNVAFMDTAGAAEAVATADGALVPQVGASHVASSLWVVDLHAGTLQSIFERPCMKHLRMSPASGIAVRDCSQPQDRILWLDREGRIQGRGAAIPYGTLSPNAALIAGSYKDLRVLDTHSGREVCAGSNKNRHQQARSGRLER